MFFTLGGSDYVCSGTALLSGNKSVVWTAGHCVNEGPGAFATNWQFVPAYKDGSAPLGAYVAENLFTTSAWGNSGDFSYDLGAAVVAPAGGTALTDRVGGRGIAFNSARSQTYQSYGYPAAPPFDGERLWRCTSPLQTSDTGANPATLGIGCDMTGGSSGGGWIVGSNVVSVNSYGYDNQPDVMYGPYQATSRSRSTTRPPRTAVSAGLPASPRARAASLDLDRADHPGVHGAQEVQRRALLGRDLERHLALGREVDRVAGGVEAASPAGSTSATCRHRRSPR